MNFFNFRVVRSDILNPSDQGCLIRSRVLRPGANVMNTLPQPMPERTFDLPAFVYHFAIEDGHVHVGLFDRFGGNGENIVGHEHQVR